MTMKTGLIGRLPQGGGGHPGATAARPPPRRPDRQLDRADEPGLAIPELFERRGRPDQWRLQRCGSPDGDHDGVPAGIEVRIDLDLPVVRDPDVARWVDVRATTASGAPIENNSTTLAALSIPAASVPVTLGFFSVDVSAFGIP